MTDHLELIAAFADGEYVDAGQLKLALEANSGREYLIDLLALRRLIEPGSAPTARAGSSARVAGAQRPVVLPWLSGLAAALVVASAAGGFFIGRQSTTSSQIAVQPPAVTVQAVPPELLIPAPSPTRVIQMQTGKDWTERAGGN